MGSKTFVVALVAAGLTVAGLSAGPGPSSIASADPATPQPAPKTTIDHDGTYNVGTAILPGTYSSAGPVGNGACYWKRLGGPDGSDIVDNSLSKKPQVVRIESSDKAFKTDGCQPWQNTDMGSGDGPVDVPGPDAGAQLHANMGILNGLLGQFGGAQLPQP